MGGGRLVLKIGGRWELVLRKYSGDGNLRPLPHPVTNATIIKLLELEDNCLTHNVTVNNRIIIIHMSNAL